MSGNARNLDDLFQAAHEEGDLSAASLKALTVDADVAARIQAGLGVTPDDVHSEAGARIGARLVAEAVRRHVPRLRSEGADAVLALALAEVLGAPRPAISCGPSPYTCRPASCSPRSARPTCAWSRAAERSS